MKSKKVLIVESNDWNRKLFENLIGQLYSFVAVKNGMEGINEASNEKFDLILMDIQMPEMDGITATKIIRRQSTYHSVIIATVANTYGSNKKYFLEIGFDDLITKPIHPKEFLALITSKMKSDAEDEEALATINEPYDILNKDVFHQLLKYNRLETIKSIYEDFLVEFDQLIHQIDMAFPEKDKQSLIESLHTLKGNSGTLGANAIYILSREADLKTRAQDWDSLETYLKKLKIERIIFENYLREETTFKP